VRPQVVVCLGATAAQSIMGKSFKVTKERGRAVKALFGGTVVATVHPSSVLRAPDPEARARAEREFLADMKKVKKTMER
jgi:DNA polymerase